MHIFRMKLRKKTKELPIMEETVTSEDNLDINENNNLDDMWLGAGKSFSES